MPPTIKSLRESEVLAAIGRSYHTGGIGGRVNVPKGLCEKSRTWSWESVKGPRLTGDGRYITNLLWRGNTTDPAIFFDQCHHQEVADLSITASAEYPLAVGIQTQDDDVDVEGPERSANQRASVSTMQRLIIDGTSSGYIGTSIYYRLATQEGPKNDHNRIERVQCLGYSHAAIVLEGQPCVNNKIEHCLLQGRLAGQYGVVCGIFDTDPRLDSNGGDWTSVALKGGGFTIEACEVMQNQISDFWIDSKNGVIRIIAVTCEGSGRFLMTADPGNSFSIASIYCIGVKWTSNDDDVADDYEVVQHLSGGPLTITGSQFGLSSAPILLKFRVLTRRDYVGFNFTYNDISTPMRHGHFPALYPDDATGSTVQDGNGDRTPLLYPIDGPGRITPYTAMHYIERGVAVPEHWYRFQESDTEGDIYSLAKGRPRRDLTLRGDPTLQHTGRAASDATAWDSYWGRLDGTVDQNFSLDDADLYYDADTMSLVYGVTFELVSTNGAERQFLVMGSGSTTGLNLRFLSTGVIRLRSGANPAVDGTYDYRDGLAHKLYLVYKRGAGTVEVHTDAETVIAGIYTATPGHTQHVGLGDTAGIGTPDMYIREFDVYRKAAAEAFDAADVLNRMEWT